MATSDSTTPPSHNSSQQPRSPSEASISEWALTMGSELDAALSGLLLALERTPRLERQTDPRVKLQVELIAELGEILVKVAKLAGVFEWLGEEHVVLTAGGAE